MDYNYYSVPIVFRPLIKLLAQMLYDISGKGTMEDVESALNCGIDITNVTDLTSPIADGFLPVAVGFLALYLMLAILDKVSNGEGVTPDMWFKLFIKFIVAFFLILNSQEIITWCLKMGDGIFNIITSKVAEFTQNASGTNNEDFKLELADWVANTIISKHGIVKIPTIDGLSDLDKLGNLWTALCTGIAWFWALSGYFHWLLFPWLLCKALYIVTLTVSITRLLELGVRAIFAPFAIAQAAFVENNPWGVRYLKQYLSICIQGAVIIGITFLMSLVSGSAELNAQDMASLMEGLSVFKNPTIIITIIVRLAGTSLIMKSRSLCDDIIGV